MAYARKCDRCGKYYSEAVAYPTVKLIDERSKQINYIGNSCYVCDLCDDCWNKFREWWEKR